MLYRNDNFLLIYEGNLFSWNNLPCDDVVLMRMYRA